MDLLLSLPIVSYFGGPVFTSWSGSMNLLFFYMTWTTLVLSHSPLKIELVGTLAVRIVFWLVPSLFFLIFDTLLPSLAESIKLYGSASLPRRNAASLFRQVLLALFNLALSTAVQAGISIGAGSLLRHPLFKTSTRLPLPWQIVKHIWLLYTAREVLTYYISRYILHSRGGIAKLHKSYAHSRKGAAPYALMLYTDHPLPLLLHRTLPVYLPALVIQPHLLTYFLFTILTTLEEMLSMSGYSMVPGIVMGGIAKRTATHYASGGRGNFGAWGLLDWVGGTSVGKDVVEDISDEAEKHQVKERSQKAASDTGSLIQDSIDGLKKVRKTRKRTSD
ncbi:sterol desaturase family protein [Annulohypoxylon maeteangense]|uniref:sterol desaturase family protein n=1 Tax=Annulohypoxylon maeteangense TaxID=1927788 RepID=UPI0020086A50|nr:sterol desaturase family protein [Annulohypoxylon maeteangense]KAI0889093.1 sterol desaturase family protein [Annulohypoxylon maeteangense]